MENKHVIYLFIYNTIGHELLKYCVKLCNLLGKKNTICVFVTENSLDSI